MYGTRGNHQSRIDCATNDPAQRVPCSFIKPIEEIIKSMLYHVSRRTVIEPEKYFMKKLIKTIRRPFTDHQG